MTDDVTRLARVLNLEIPVGYDAVQAIELDIKRLLYTEQQWTEACAIARIHCPVGDGESHVRQGIPRLADALKRAKDAASFPPWLADAAEALGECRPEDGAPLALNWTQVIAAIHELREDRDHWKLRAEQAEFSLGVSRDECASLRQNEAILAEQACPEGHLR